MKRSKLFDSQGAKGGSLSRRGRKAIAATTTPRLLTISDDDRQKLLSSRVSNILEEKSDDFNLYLTQGKKTFENIPKRLDQYREKDCPLWKKGTTVYDHDEDESHEDQLSPRKRGRDDVKDEKTTKEVENSQKQVEGKIEESSQKKVEVQIEENSQKKVEMKVEASVRSVQEIGIQTDDVIIVIVKKFEEKGVQTEPQVMTMEEETSHKEKDEDDDVLIDVRQEERSFEYLDKSFNYEYNEDFNKCFTNDQSPSIFENSRNDKVFANKLVAKSSKKKRRRTWSEKSYRGNSCVSSDNDSIIVLDPVNDNIPKDHHDEHASSSSDAVMSTDDNVASWSWKETPRHPSGNDNDDEDDQEVHVLPMQSVWNTSCDDAFFMNLPNDEELLNLPPTSPTGDKRYVCTSSPSFQGTKKIVKPPFSSMGLSPITKGDSLATKVGKPKKQLRKRSSTQATKKTEKDKGSKTTARARSKGKSHSSMENDDEHSPWAGGSKHFKSQRNRAREMGGHSNNDNCTTPIISSSQGDPRSPQTPMLNYSLIDTPILKKELNRYGLKPFPRSKAKVLLRHIYKETHK